MPEETKIENGEVVVTRRMSKADYIAKLRGEIKSITDRATVLQARLTEATTTVEEKITELENLTA